MHSEADYDRLPSGQVGLEDRAELLSVQEHQGKAPDGKTLWEMPPAIGESPAGKKLSGTPRGEEGATGRVANQPTRPQSVDAAKALGAKAEIRSGRWLVEGTELVQASADRDQMSIVLFGHPGWIDYDLTFEMKSDQGTGAANVIYRATQLGKRAHVFVIPAKPDECWIEVWPEGGHDGDPGFEGPDRFSFVKGKWFPVRVRVRGNQSVCSIFENGQEVVSMAWGPANT